MVNTRILFNMKMPLGLVFVLLILCKLDTYWKIMRYVYIKRQNFIMLQWLRRTYQCYYDEKYFSRPFCIDQSTVLYWSI